MVLEYSLFAAPSNGADRFSLFPSFSICAGAVFGASGRVFGGGFQIGACRHKESNDRID